MGDSEGKAAAIGGGAYVSSYAAAPSARRWTANSSSVDGWGWVSEWLSDGFSVP